MKGILKKNQIMITALAIMLAIAGYLNFTSNKLEEEVAATSSEGVVNDEIAMDDASVSDELALDISDSDTNEYVTIESLDTDIDMAATDTDDQLNVAKNETVLDGDIPGEAVFASTSSVTSLSSAKLMKEQTRAKNKETLLGIINSTAIDNEQKQEAIDNMLKSTEIAEKEMAAEILLESKGFSNAVVSMSGDSVDVLVGASELSDAQRAQIEDIVKRKTGVSAENIIITPISE